MQDFTYHIHTSRCDHALGTDEQYVQAAIEAGYKIMGFSDHAPYHNMPYTRHRMSMSQLQDYKDSVLSLREKYQNQIEIHMGVECEPFQNHMDEIDMYFKEMEYVILSLHGKDDRQPFLYSHPNSDQEILEYGYFAEKTMAQRPWFYLAHPDYYLREQYDFNDACQQTAHRICQAAVKNNIILEVNLTAAFYGKQQMKQGDFYFSPNLLFWQIAAQYPVKCIIGLDAHKPSVLTSTDIHRKALEELQSLNLNFVDEPLLKNR